MYSSSYMSTEKPLSDLVSSLFEKSHQCVLSSCCEILPDTILAPGTVVPPFSVYGGQPGRLVDSLPEGFVEAQAMLIKAHYDRFQPASDGTENLETSDYTYTADTS